MNQKIVAILCASLFGGAALVSSGATLAQQKVEKDVVDFGKDKPTPAEIIEALNPRKCEPPTQCRGFRRDVPTRKAVNLELTFLTNSATLTDEAKQQLNAVGKALSSEELASVKFHIEGHADARGSASYNMALSERRAMSVKQYLTSQFSIANNRLQPLGRGKEELKDPAHPESEVNRRVEIVTATAF